MLVLGVLLIVLAGATVVAVSWDEAATATATATFTVFDRTLQLSQLEFFFAGAVTGAVFLLGLALLFAGTRRSAVRRRRMRDSRLEARDRVARLEREKQELERKLAETPETPSVDPETTAPHPRVEVPRQHSADQLVAGRHTRPPK
ncbi:hypothetical protein ACFQ08_11840 [Streptosporangium algeriense]|uniref:DUF1049 domain-containing protein n=1 Tax=Streptosporangium algeriense TaxID=1682748 RepID=A0ABW3DMW6_9ACTN